MKNKELIIGLDKKKIIAIPVNECNLFEKIIGLMFSRREKARILLFNFKRKQKLAIHSFFVFYPFVALWLDEKNEILEKKIVRPFESSVRSTKDFFKLIEIPINKKNKKFIELFVADHICRR